MNIRFKTNTTSRNSNPDTNISKALALSLMIILSIFSV